MQLNKVCYILLHFPYLTETFIAEEIHAIRSLSTDVSIISILESGTGPVQPLSQRLLPYTWYAPGLFTLYLWKAQIHFLIKNPYLYFNLLLQLLSQPYPRQFITRLAKRLYIFLKAVSVAYYLEGSDFQLVHAHFAWLSGASAWIIASLIGLPFTVTVHAFDIYSHKNDLLNLISKQANHVIAISEYNRKQLLSLGTRPAEDISIIHCGVDLDKLQSKTKTQIEHPGESLVRILSVGSLVAKKGHTYLIAACHQLKKQGVNFSCTIIGDGPEIHELNKQIQECNLQNQVRLLGARSHPEIISAYHQHDLFVLACIVTPNGDRDGIPVVLMEAGAAGLPLISTNVSGISELVRHGQTGWLIPSCDSPALADAIAFLAAEPALKVRIGQNAQVLVETEFNITSNALQLASLFQSVYNK